MKDHKTGSAQLITPDRRDVVGPARDSRDIGETVNDSRRIPIASHRRLSPAEFGVHRDFLDSLRKLKVGLVRACYYLRMIKDRKIYRALGYPSIVAYARSEAGLSRRQCETFLELAHRLPELPEITDLVDQGDLSWGKARLLCRVVTPETEHSWIEVARGLTARQLADVVRRAKEERQRAPDGNDDLTSKPLAESRSSGCRHAGGNQREERAEKPNVVSPSPEVEKTATTRTANQDAANEVHRQPGHRRARDPVLLGNGPNPISQPLLAPDATVHVTLKFTPVEYVHWTAWLAASQRASGPRNSNEHRLLEALDGGGRVTYCVVVQECPKCGRATVATPRGEVAAPPAILGRARCDGEIQDPVGNRRQAIPPRLRRQVLARDGHGCRAEGCRHTHHLEIHHLRPSSHGGRTEIDNLITLCARCHRAVHEREAGLQRDRREPPA